MRALCGLISSSVRVGGPVVYDNQIAASPHAAAYQRPATAALRLVLDVDALGYQTVRFPVLAIPPEPIRADTTSMSLRQRAGPQRRLIKSSKNWLHRLANPWSSRGQGSRTECSLFPS